MSSLILDSVVAISRLQKDLDNSSKESFVQNAALQDVKCQIQPATPEETAVANGVFGQTFLMFTSVSGIFPGDYITVSGTGEGYRVRGVENWAGIEGIPHYEITLLRLEEDEVLY
jgi:hypothetical protein